MKPRVLITGHGIDALVTNYVLADLGYSPTIVTPHPTSTAIQFTQGPWRHTGNSKLLARMLEDLDMEHEEHTLTVALDGEDWSGKRAIKQADASAHTLFDRFPDIKRTLAGNDTGLFFERDKLMRELRSIASLSTSALVGRLVLVNDSANQPMMLYSYRGERRPGWTLPLDWEPFDHMIVTDRPTLNRLVYRTKDQLPANEQAVYRIKDASFPGKRFDVNYYSEGDVIRVTTRGDVTFVQARGHLTNTSLAWFGGKLVGHEPWIQGLDVEACKPLVADLPRGVHTLGSAATGIDQTISDVMDVAHKWGMQWQI